MRHERQTDLFKPIDLPIHLLGAGGIGSWTALLLAKMGCQKITVYDNDVVQDHNVASQFYKEKQLGMEKTIALRKNVLEHSGVTIRTAPIEVEKDINEGLVIIAVDSMLERGRLAEMFKDKPIYIIDARMGGLKLEIYSQPAAGYPATIVPLDDISPEPCTARSICFNCAIIGGLIANQVRLLAADKNIDGEFEMLFADEVHLLKGKV